MLLFHRYRGAQEREQGNAERTWNIESLHQKSIPKIAPEALGLTHKRAYRRILKKGVVAS